MDNEHPERPEASPEPPRPAQQDKQCRICYDNEESDPSLGRLFKPCLCAGTISVSGLGRSCQTTALLITLAQASTFTSNVCRDGD
ncbi:hypothetical protein JVU11DRAFT_5089 [Chiua virens]|nr:hypothetical protein JVU11DRAFT_5089 [Chiua virens]